MNSAFKRSGKLGKGPHAPSSGNLGNRKIMPSPLGQDVDTKLGGPQ